MNRNQITFDYASRNKRLLNFIIDGLVVCIIVVLFFIVLARHNFTYLISIVDTLDWGYDSDNLKLSIDFNIIVIYFTYYFSSELIFKTTLGKIITRTKVIQINGQPLNLRSVLIRSLTRLIPLEQLSFISTFPVGVHDSLSDTRVVNYKKRIS